MEKAFIPEKLQPFDEFGQAVIDANGFVTPMPRIEGSVGPKFLWNFAVKHNDATGDDMKAAARCIDPNVVEHLQNGTAAANPKLVLVIYGLRRAVIDGLEAEATSVLADLFQNLHLHTDGVGVDDEYFHIGGALEMPQVQPDAGSVGTGDFHAFASKPEIWERGIVVDLETDTFEALTYAAVSLAGAADVIATGEFIGCVFDKKHVLTSYQPKACGGELSAETRFELIRDNRAAVFARLK